MTLVLPCSYCGDPYKSGDLYWFEIDPPDYIDLPEDSEHVDMGDPDDEPVLRLQYCGECIGRTHTPPLISESDDDPPEPHRP